MRQITTGERKLITIMEKYGKVEATIDLGGNECCSFVGNIHTKENTWMHMGYGVDAGYNLREPLSPIDETYLALNEAVWNCVKELSGR